MEKVHSLARQLISLSVKRPHTNSILNDHQHPTQFLPDKQRKHLCIHRHTTHTQKPGDILVRLNPPLGRRWCRRECPQGEAEDKYRRDRKKRPEQNEITSLPCGTFAALSRLELGEGKKAKAEVDKK